MQPTPGSRFLNVDLKWVKVWPGTAPPSRPIGSAFVSLLHKLRASPSYSPARLSPFFSTNSANPKLRTASALSYSHPPPPWACDSPTIVMPAMAVDPMSIASSSSTSHATDSKQMLEITSNDPCSTDPKVYPVDQARVYQQALSTSDPYDTTAAADQRQVITCPSCLPRPLFCLGVVWFDSGAQNQGAGLREAEQWLARKSTTRWRTW
jgi:hypothetical protein